MTPTAHTPGHIPGPWAWQLFGKEYYLTGQHSDRPIILSTIKGKLACHSKGLLVPLDPSNPDMRLIAAAPDLLEALEMLVSMITGEYKGGEASASEKAAAMVSASAAIRKARGEEA